MQPLRHSIDWSICNRHIQQWRIGRGKTIIYTNAAAGFKMCRLSQPEIVVVSKMQGKIIEILDFFRQRFWVLTL